MRRVVITGYGAVTPLGIGADKHIAGLREGRDGVGPIQLIDSSRLMIKIAAEVSDFDGDAHFSRSEQAMLDRVSQMALIAAREAVNRSGVSFDGEAGLRAATVLGCSMGGQLSMERGYHTLYAEGKNRIHPFTVPKLMGNAPASQISMDHGLRGPAWSVSTACASSNHAIGQAFQLIRSGAVDRALTGGSEAGLTFGVLKAWEGLRVMSKEACRPFSANRNGMVQGEGAAIIVLEELESAKARGAEIYGEITGFGMTADAGEIVTPSQDGAARAMRMALDDARMTGDEISYVNAHGTGTAANDKTECAAIRQVFGAHADNLIVSSTKSMHGHSIGAAGAIEMLAVIAALNHDFAPPTINFTEPDPECDLNVAPNAAIEGRYDAAMSNSFAFGGLNAVVCARRFVQ